MTNLKFFARMYNPNWKDNHIKVARKNYKKKVTNNTYTIHLYDNSWKSNKDKLKRKVMQYATRIIGEDTRAKLVSLKNKL